VNKIQACHPWLTLLMFSAPILAQQTVEDKTGQPSVLGIRLLYSDYANVPVSVVTEGLQTAERIFSKAGVQMTASEIQPDWKQSQSGQNLAPVIFLRILPDAMANRSEQRFEAIGSAYSTDDNTGQIANVFYDRLQGLPTSPFCSRGTMLGNVIAHEMGHLLLGRKSHSPSGIMSANWQRDNQIVQLRAGALLFRRDESERIRKNILERQRSLSVISAVP
jgi:hypothetical protein